MAQKKVKIGVFGLGRGSHYLQSFLDCGAEVVAVCDRIQSRLDEAVKVVGEGLATYTDFDAFIEHEGLNGVFLAVLLAIMAMITLNDVTKLFT